MYPPVPTFPPLPKRVCGNRVREARARQESGDWQAWPDADAPSQPNTTADDQRQDES
ncbi:hypothetical protein [Streptacidiphilus melanogenes]|uniref:hypothetical protein n=1 Tax=Streptacidiphilus melanogenes TaxID=411235 RepID=UPI000AB50216|nr:hypothetical protein [Streptacidiphilus melanogenes]